MNSRRFFPKPTVCLAAILLAAAAINAKPRSFHELVDAYFDDYFKANPSQATNVGFHQYDRQLEDFSVAAHQRNRRKLLEYLAAFQALNPGPLSLLERDDREIMIATIHSLLLEEDRVQQWRKNPDAYSGEATSSIAAQPAENFHRHRDRSIARQCGFLC